MSCYPNQCSTTVTTAVERAVPALQRHAEGLAFTGGAIEQALLLAIVLIVVAAVMIALSKLGRK